MSNISFFVYRSDLVGSVSTRRRVVRWGGCQLSNLAAQAWRPNEIAVENTANRFFQKTSADVGIEWAHYYDISTGAFTTEAVNTTAPVLPFEGENQAVNFGAQTNARHTGADRLLRYFGLEGSFGLGSTVPSSLASFTVVAPPTGFYICDESTVTGGPSTGAFTLVVLVQRSGANTTLFNARRIATGANYREWNGIRTTATGAVTWTEVTGRVFAGSTPGSVPTSAGGTVDFLRADGTWANPTFVGLTPTITANFASGATVSGAIKTVNIGTGGTSGSDTIINIGPAAAGSTGETRIGGNFLRMNTSVKEVSLNTATLFRNAESPSTFAAAATLTVADLIKGVVTFTGASNATLTMPTGAELDAAFPNVLANTGFEFSIIAANAGDATIAISTGVGRQGSGIVAGGTSGRYLCRRGSTASWVIYRT